MYEVTVKGGVYARPAGICVACGGFAMGNHGIKKGNSDFQGKTFLNMEFPLCDDCAAVAEKHYERPHDVADQAVLERIETAKANRPRRLLFHAKLDADPADLARLKEIEAEDREWTKHKADEDREKRKAIDRSVAIKGVSRSKATFRFSNAVYGHAFAQANLGRSVERAA